MTTTKQYKAILEYLQHSHSGARMMKDMELEMRIARAIIAFEADTHEDIFVDGLIEKEIEKEMSGTIHYKVKQEVDEDLIKALRCLASESEDSMGSCSESKRNPKISCIGGKGFEQCQFYQNKYYTCFGTEETSEWLNKVADILEGK